MKKWCRTFLLSCLLCLSLCTLAQATDGETLRVGLKYGSDAMSAANLQNYSAFGGYALGYFDADGSFEELGALPRLYEKITVTTDTTYHVQLSGTFYDYDDASRTAAQYSGGFAAYRGWRVLCARWQLHEPECGAVRGSPIRRHCRRRQQHGRDGHCDGNGYDPL